MKERMTYFLKNITVQENIKKKKYMKFKRSQVMKKTTWKGMYQSTNNTK